MKPGCDKNCCPWLFAIHNFRQKIDLCFIMADSHHHHNGHLHSLPVHQAGNRAFILSIVLNLLYVAVEAGAGFITNSLALITDAGHNLIDVTSLGLSLAAFRLARIKPTKTFTYGYKKTTIIAALLNAAILLIVIGILGYEAIIRLNHPAPVEGSVISLIAGIGIIVNAFSAYLFFKSQKQELNARGAYLHLLADAAVSIAVVISGLLIFATGWFWLDPVISLVVLIVILFSTWSLLSESLRLSLDAVPKGVDIAEIEALIKKTPGVLNVHHIHVWPMSTTENALTAHVVISGDIKSDSHKAMVKNIKHELFHHQIHHATLELETVHCKQELCPDHAIE
jgi:cobalt-zinc-cadmium efflux system protein